MDWFNHRRVTEKCQKPPSHAGAAGGQPALQLRFGFGSSVEGGARSASGGLGVHGRHPKPTAFPPAGVWGRQHQPALSLDL